MLQNPKIAFKDPDLMTCAIALNSNNQPKPLSGAFAVVYKGTYQAGATRKGDVCIRVFSKASADRQERYKAISEYLKLNPLKCLVDFEYLEKGIRHQSGKWYPLVRMEWVQGDILYDYARHRCRAGDSQSLGKLTENWVELVSDLARAKIAHGDLQHANVMVTDRGELKLVDYDCMCVPALTGMRNLELGVVPYQNPRRTDDTLLFPGLDNFSSIFIYVALRALSTSPKMWDAYVEPPGGLPYDKLLIRDTDFENPGTSVLMGDLKQSSDQKVRKLTDKLLQFWNTDLKDIPTLSEVLNDYEKIGSLLTAKSFDEALVLLNHSAPSAPPPKNLQSGIENARQRVKCREDLERAIAAGDELAIKQAYRPQLLDDYAKAQSAVEIARDADRAITVLKELQGARSQQDWRGFVQVWERESRLLAPRKSAAAFSIEFQHWKKLNAACDEVWQAYRRRPPDLPNLKTAWGQLEQFGGHPETQAERMRIEDLLRKYGLLSEFSRLQGPIGATLDAARCKVWREDDFQGWTEADQYRQEYESARDRLQLYTELRLAVQQTPDADSIQSEQAIVELFRKLPTPYEIEDAVKKRTLEANDRLRCCQAWQRASTARPLVDTMLGKAWQELVKLRARELIPLPFHGRSELAASRIPVLTGLAAVVLSQPLDRLDAELLRVWNHQLLTAYEEDPNLRCDEAEPWRLPHEHAVQRRELLQRLEQALAASDASAVKQVSSDPLLKSYPLPDHVRQQISTSLVDLNAMTDLLGAVKAGDRTKFHQQFNAGLIKRFRSDFENVQAELECLIATEILPNSKNGFRRPLGAEPIVERAPGQLIFDIQWNWPAPRFVDRVIIGICRGTPPPFPDPGKLVTRQTTDRQLLRSGSGKFVLPAKREWLNSLVVVWGVVDLGFREYFTEPFLVGRLSSRGAK